MASSEDPKTGWDVAGEAGATDVAGRCRTCELTARRDAGRAPMWDSIIRTPGWDLVHSFNTALEGWLVLVARRHITSLAELTDTEATEFGPLVQQVSAALERVTGCEKTYLAQFAESADHRHVHVHLVARQPDLDRALAGPRIFQLLGVDESQRVADDRMNQLAAALRTELVP